MGKRRRASSKVYADSGKEKIGMAFADERIST
jgi:hypothetical protein